VRTPWCAPRLLPVRRCSAASRQHAPLSFCLLGAARERSPPRRSCSSPPASSRPRRRGASRPPWPPSPPPRRPRRRARPAHARLRRAGTLGRSAVRLEPVLVSKATGVEASPSQFATLWILATRISLRRETAGGGTKASVRRLRTKEVQRINVVAAQRTSHLHFCCISSSIATEGHLFCCH